MKTPKKKFCFSLAVCFFFFSECVCVVLLFLKKKNLSLDVRPAIRRDHSSIGEDTAVACFSNRPINIDQCDRSRTGILFFFIFVCVCVCYFFCPNQGNAFTYRGVVFANFKKIKKTSTVQSYPKHTTYARPYFFLFCLQALERKILFL